MVEPCAGCSEHIFYGKRYAEGNNGIVRAFHRRCLVSFKEAISCTLAAVRSGEVRSPAVHRATQEETLHNDD